MKLVLLGIIALILIIYTAYTLFRPGEINWQAVTGKIETTHSAQIRLAKKVYQEKKKEKVNFKESPCLADDLGEGWALDIVHNPRIVQDEINQCESYKQGKVKHIIEMTPDGTIIRME